MSEPEKKASQLEETPKEDPGPKTEDRKEPEAPWSEKYRPKTIGEVVGNNTAKESIDRWAQQWENGKPKKSALLIYGNVGSGKTSLCQALASDHDWEILEMNASDKRTQALVEQIAGVGSQSRSFSGKKRLILIEEMEGLSGTADRGAGKALVKVIQESRTPIVLTCNDINNRKLSGVKVYCEKVGLKKIPPGPIVQRLKQILESEGVKTDEVKPLQMIADNCEGDMRSAINDLQALAQEEESLKEGSIFLEQRDRPIDVYKAMQKIFKCNDYSKCRRVMWDLDEEPRNFVAWMDENIPVEYKEKTEISKAYNQLSRADIFLGRVSKRQYWGFLRYVNDLMTVGIGFSKEKPSYGFSKYRFPSLIMRMGATRGKRSKEKAIASKISPIVHDSSSRIIGNYLPLLKNVFDKDKEAGMDMVEGFELDESEMDFLA
jgi:replication factor C large subunit